jgi:hypothetical protein
VRSSTTKLHSAISPSMNDQWSGKTLRMSFFPAPARPSRSSAHVPSDPTGLGFDAVAASVRLLVATLLVSILESVLTASHAPSSSPRWAR